jgi:hypothetical protein
VGTVPTERYVDCDRAWHFGECSDHGKGVNPALGKGVIGEGVKKNTATTLANSGSKLGLNNFLRRVGSSVGTVPTER